MKSLVVPLDSSADLARAVSAVVSSTIVLDIVLELAMTKGVMRGGNGAYAIKVPCNFTYWMLWIKQVHMLGTSGEY